MFGRSSPEAESFARRDEASELRPYLSTPDKQGNHEVNVERPHDTGGCQYKPATNRDPFQPEICEASRLMASFNRGGAFQDAGTVHERLYREAGTNRKRKEDLDKIDAEARARSLARNRARKGRPDNKLYLDAQAKREALQSLQRKAEEELRSLRDVPKFGQRSRAVYRHKLFRELRAAVDWCQPHRPGSLTLQASLVGCLFQYLGLFHEDHVGELFSATRGNARNSVALPASANRHGRTEKDATFNIVRDLQARTRLTTEKILASQLAENLDVENLGEIPVDRLFSFLAAVTTESLDSRGRWTAAEGASLKQGGGVDPGCIYEATRELHAWGALRNAANTAPTSPAPRPGAEGIQAKQLEQLDKDMTRLRKIFSHLMVIRSRKRECGICAPAFASAFTDALQGVTFRPQINPLSEAIAKRSREREAQKQNGHVDLPDRLLARAQVVQAAKERLRVEQAKQELEGCTFHPKIIHSRIMSANAPATSRDAAKPFKCWASLSVRRLSSIHAHGATGSQTTETLSPLQPAGTAPLSCRGDMKERRSHCSHAECDRRQKTKRAWSCEERRKISRGEVLYLEGRRQLESQERTFEHIRALKREAELQECTFAPAISHSLPRATARDQAAAKPAGFDSCVARIRQAAKRRDELLMFHEIRDPSTSARARKGHRRSTLPQPFSFAEGRYKVQLAPEVFSMTVEVGKGRKGRMSVREGEDPRLVARSFAKAYSLSADEADWITSVLLQEMAERMLLAIASTEPGRPASPLARGPPPEAPSTESSWCLSPFRVPPLRSPQDGRAGSTRLSLENVLDREELSLRVASPAKAMKSSAAREPPDSNPNTEKRPRPRELMTRLGSPQECIATKSRPDTAVSPYVPSLPVAASLTGKSLAGGSRRQSPPSLGSREAAHPPTGTAIFAAAPAFSALVSSESYAEEGSRSAFRQAAGSGTGSPGAARRHKEAASRTPAKKGEGQRGQRAVRSGVACCSGEASEAPPPEASVPLEEDPSSCPNALHASSLGSIDLSRQLLASPVHPSVFDDDPGGGLAVPPPCTP
ncbi:hypothetical protein BESB_008570 [Besnoitia besnoiti]|uniref:Uncharacterized protein n=1 Tax=Besnoitia besnoiti TaxID=94643 RepID=A0A2A9MKJ6_BESBE|nr:hypothetical protein BESB_008570 [Besnoitia besnoiti]PFH38515.1 hypothetical protein BESB_008570 [Besnoitia besnoiti]